MRGEQTGELTRGKLHGDCFVNMQYALDQTLARQNMKEVHCVLGSGITFLVQLFS